MARDKGLRLSRFSSGLGLQSLWESICNKRIYAFRAQAFRVRALDAKGFQGLGLDAELDGLSGIGLSPCNIA